MCPVLFLFYFCCSLYRTFKTPIITSKLIVICYHFWACNLALVIKCPAGNNTPPLGENAPRCPLPPDIYYYDLYPGYIEYRPVVRVQLYRTPVPQSTLISEFKLKLSPAGDLTWAEASAYANFLIHMQHHNSGYQQIGRCSIYMMRASREQLHSLCAYHCAHVHARIGPERTWIWQRSPRCGPAYSSIYDFNWIHSTFEWIIRCVQKKTPAN